MLLSALRLLMACLLAATLAYCLLALLAARAFAARPSRKNEHAARPPASILIPLCGADFKAYELYSAFCRQDYPDYQILFGVRDPKDSSVPVIEKLIADYPDRDISLVVGRESIGRNPKVDNLHNMLGRAKHERIVIVDSDIRVGGDFLASVVPPLCDDRVGLVTCFYRSGEAPGLASRFESIGITGEFAPGVLVAWFTEGISFALGATMATTKSKLHAIGGLRAIADYLADDFKLGNLLKKAGHEVYLSSHLVETIMRPESFMGMARHQLRWSRAIRASRPMGHLGSFVTHGWALALLALLVDHHSALSFVLPGLAVLMQGLVAWVVGVRLLGDKILEKNFWLLPLRDFFGLGIWGMSLMGRTVEWRGRTFAITEDGKMVPLR